MWKDKVKRVLDSSSMVRRRRTARQARELATWQGRGHPQPTPHAYKSTRIRQVARQFDCKALIETGTCLGEMIVATASDFDRIHSIELSMQLAGRAQDRLAWHPHVTVHQGDSAVVLPPLLAKTKSRTLIWLDAHYSGGVTARGSIDSPIVQELKTISQYPGHCILIDDAHMFDGNGGYPTVEETRELADQWFPNYRFVNQNNILEILPA